jgi:hypothetical protein
MLFECLVVGGVLYFGLSGHGVRESARLAGRAVGRASGGLRRARAASERLQARAEEMGGSELQGSRMEIVARMQRLRDIQMELAALTAVGGVGGGAAGAAPPPVFSDAELAEAMGGGAPVAPQAGAGAAAGGGGGGAGRAAQPAYFADGKPVYAARFEQRWDAGSSVPRQAGAADAAGDAEGAQGAGHGAERNGGGDVPLSKRLAAIALEPPLR